MATMTTGVSSGLVLNKVQPITLAAGDLQQALEHRHLHGQHDRQRRAVRLLYRRESNDYSAGIYNGISVDIPR